MTARLDQQHADAATRFRLGLLLAIGSAFAFGVSGPLGKSLMTAGWSPAAAVTARLAGGAVAMAAVASVLHPGWVREAYRHVRTVAAYGLVPIAGAQLFYFNAVSHLSVGVALLLEYTAPVLVVGWLWATTRRRPAALVLAGVLTAVAGITLVLDVFSEARIDLVGVGWGLAAAICAACYFLMSDTSRSGTAGPGLHPLTLSAGGLAVGAAALAALGACGAMPMRFTTADALIAGATVPWYVPVVALGLVPTAVAYTLGIMGIARLRPRFASLVGLFEVMFAVLSAWVLLGEAVTGVQALGGAVVLAGLALARAGDRAGDTADGDVGERAGPVADATWPDTPAEGAVPAR